MSNENPCKITCKISNKWFASQYHVDQFRNKEKNCTIPIANNDTAINKVVYIVLLAANQFLDS